MVDSGQERGEARLDGENRGCADGGSGIDFSACMFPGTDPAGRAPAAASGQDRQGIQCCFGAAVGVDEGAKGDRADVF